MRERDIEYLREIGRQLMDSIFLVPQDMYLFLYSPPIFIMQALLDAFIKHSEVSQR